MSKMGQELEKRLDENKYEMYEALKEFSQAMAIAWAKMEFNVAPSWIRKADDLTRQVLAKIEGEKK